MSRLEFADKGYKIIPEYLTEDDCVGLLSAINDYRKLHAVPEIHRQAGKRPLHYSVIDGERIREHLRQVLKLFHDANQVVNSITGLDLTPLSDEKVAVNINITSKGGAYRWHYDRNAVTAILYLNKSQGGETECYPNYRISLNGNGNSRFQQPLDRLLQARFVRKAFGKRVIVEPSPGKLLIMRGDRCLHSVRPVDGDGDRFNIIMSFDIPGKSFDVAANLNKYLYETADESEGDPNYVR